MGVVVARTKVVAGSVTGGDLSFLLGSALGWPLFLWFAFLALALFSTLTLPFAGCCGTRFDCLPFPRLHSGVRV